VPTHVLKTGEDRFPALIGSRMAKSTGLKVGDTVTLRWRDANGTFDARDVEIVQVMKTVVPSIDQGQVWIPLDRLRALAGMEGEASLVVVAQGALERPRAPDGFSGPRLPPQRHQTAGQDEERGRRDPVYGVDPAGHAGHLRHPGLVHLPAQKRDGTLMALGFTRGRVIRLFTLEGALHGVLAAIVAALYGIPLLTWYAGQGWALPEGMDSYGFAIGEKLFPVYSAGLVAGRRCLSCSSPPSSASCPPQDCQAETDRSPPRTDLMIKFLLKA